MKNLSGGPKYRGSAALVCAVLFALGAASAAADDPGKCFYTVCPIVDSSGRVVIEV